jgi:hypothetical protein
VGPRGDLDAVMKSEAFDPSFVVTQSLPVSEKKGRKPHIISDSVVGIVLSRLAGCLSTSYREWTYMSTYSQIARVMSGVSD